LSQAVTLWIFSTDQIPSRLPRTRRPVTKDD